MAAVIFHEPVFATTVESGDKLYFYEVGTTTDLTVYTDYALTTPASQPVVADANGRFVPLYIDGTGNDPKVVLHDSDDVEKWTCDRYPVDDLTTLTADVATNTADIAVLEGRMATAEADIDVLETESADYETRISDLEGTTDTVVDGDFTGSNQDLVSSGYQKFPGGLIIQWGKFTVAADTANHAATFPLEFPNACLQAVGTAVASALDTEDNWGLGTTAPTTTTLYWTNGTAASTTVRWMAIGY